MLTYRIFRKLYVTDFAGMFA